MSHVPYHADKASTDSPENEKDEILNVPAGAEQKVVNNAEFLAATQVKLDWRTKESRTVLFGCFVSFMCAIANGYDGSLMGAITAMPYYGAYFNNAAAFSTGTGLIFSIYTVGQIVGGLMSGFISDKFGRRAGMFTGCFLVVAGCVLTASSHHIEQFIAGRFVLGWGIAIAVSCAPSYCIEIAPPQWRGRMTGFYNTGWFGGSIPAAAICLGTQDMSSNWSWRIPLICQCVPAGIVCLSIFTLPESPRWLMARGRHEEARAFLVKYHGAGDSNAATVQVQYKEFQESIELDGSDTRWWDLSDIIGTKNARWRFLQVVLMGVFGQFSGNGLGYFNPKIFELLNYDRIMQFVLNLAISIVSATGAYTGVYFTDRMSRRQVLVWGTFACAVCLGINAGLQTEYAKHLENPNKKLAQGALSAYFMFNLVNSFTYTPLQALYPVECLSTNARGKGMGLYQVVVNCISFINLFAGPIAIKNITYKYIYIFVGWDCVEALIWYFCAIDTNGRTLEELDEIFSAPNPVRASKQKRLVAVAANRVVEVGN